MSIVLDAEGELDDATGLRDPGVSGFPYVHNEALEPHSSAPLAQASVRGSATAGSTAPVSAQSSSKGTFYANVSGPMAADYGAMLHTAVVRPLTAPDLGALMLGLLAGAGMLSLSLLYMSWDEVSLPELVVPAALTVYVYFHYYGVYRRWGLGRLLGLDSSSSPGGSNADPKSASSSLPEEFDDLGACAVVHRRHAHAALFMMPIAGHSRDHSWSGLPAPTHFSAKRTPSPYLLYTGSGNGANHGSLEPRILKNISTPPASLSLFPPHPRPVLCLDALASVQCRHFVAWSSYQVRARFLRRARKPSWSCASAP